MPYEPATTMMLLETETVGISGVEFLIVIHSMLHILILLRILKIILIYSNLKCHCLLNRGL